MLTKTDILHVAKLARLELKPKEVKLYTEQLSRVLDYIDQLKEVDTTGVAPIGQVSELVNRTRVDEIKPWPKSEVKKLLATADKVGELVKVKRVLN